jgi:hypothetical protein
VNASAGAENAVLIGRYVNSTRSNTICIKNRSFTAPYSDNVYVSNIYNLNINGNTPDSNVISVGDSNYGLLYCNVQTGHIIVIGQ